MVARRLAWGGWVTAICTAASVVALALPGEAAAWYGPPPVTAPSLWPTVYTAVSGTTSTAGLSGEAAAAVGTANVAASATPALTALGTFSIAAGGLTAGYLVGSQLNKWFGISSAIIGNNDPYAAGAYTSRLIGWGWAGSDQTGPYGSWWPSLPAAVKAGACVAGCWLATIQVDGIGAYPIWNTCGVDCGATNSLIAASTAITAGTHSFEASVLSHYVTPSAMVGAVTRAPLTPYVAQPYEMSNTAWGNAPADPGTGSQVATDVRAALEAGSPATDLAINQWIDPTYEGETSPSFVMPSCAGLTYTQCVQALQAAGHVGTITRVDLGRETADLTACAECVVSSSITYGATALLADPVTLTANPTPLPLELQALATMNETATAYAARLGLTTVTVVELSESNSDPLRGPLVPVRVSFPLPSGTATVSVPASGEGPVVDPTKRIPGPGTSVTVYVNAPSMPPVEGGVGGCEPWLTASPDLTPLTGLQLGDKFPFGVFTWVGDFLAVFNPAPTAPAFTFPVKYPTDTSGNLSTYDYEVNLNFWDAYQATIRTVSSWVLWVGAIIYLASSFLKLPFGNPADAVDEGLPL